MKIASKQNQRRKYFMLKNKTKKGITLISLVITMIILLILAGVAISIAVDRNGLIFKAQEAKEKSNIQNEKEIISLAKIEFDFSDTTGDERSKLQEILDGYTGEGKTEVSDAGDVFDVLFNDSNRYYEIDKNGNINGPQTIITDSNPGDITNGNTLDGSLDKPFEINCVEDLVAFSLMSIDGETFSEKYVKLNNNLNIKSNFSYVNATDTETFGDYNGDGTVEGIKQELLNKQGNGFKPVELFEGIFLGNNYEIQNIYIKVDSSSSYFVGLFGKNKGTIEKLKVLGHIEIDIENSDEETWSAGGIAGGSTGTIKNAESKMEITGQIQSGIGWLCTGGIVGYMAGGGIVENSSNQGEIRLVGNGDNRPGGIVGVAQGKSSIVNCHNKANIYAETTDYAMVGGIVVNLDEECTVENCYNTGKLEIIGKTRGYLGGIVAYGSYFDTIIGCYNTGLLIGSGYAPRIGGIIGAAREGITINCYNTGNIETTENSSVVRVGVILGQAFEATTLKNSYNVGVFNLKGAITLKGGIYGSVMGSVDNCYYLEQEGFAVGGEKKASATVENSASKTSEEMKKSEFLNLLNKEEENYKQDSNLINKGYPILNWQ